VIEAMPLRGRCILVVEDEPLVALDLVETFRRAGASVLSAHRLDDGLRLAALPDLSGAIVDFGLSDGEGTALCERLKERDIPFILHSGYSHVDEACLAGVVVSKPASSDVLVSTMIGLLP
jgi:DNA-binding response OmpR family regulator